MSFIDLPAHTTAASGLPAGTLLDTAMAHTDHPDWAVCDGSVVDTHRYPAMAGLPPVVGNWAGQVVNPGFEPTTLSMAAGGGSYVIRAHGNTNYPETLGFIAHSTNLTDWAKVRVANHFIGAVDYVHDRFITFGGNRLYHSADGAQWASLTLPANPARGTFRWRDKWYIPTADGLYRSDDLTQAEKISTNITLPNPPSIVVHEDELYLFSRHLNSNVTNQFAHSPDGEHWTLRDAGWGLMGNSYPHLDPVADMHSTGDVLCVKVTNRLWVSADDGATWRMGTFYVPNNLDGAFVSNKLIHYGSLVQVNSDGSLHYTDLGANALRDVHCYDGTHAMGVQYHIDGDQLYSLAIPTMTQLPDLAGKMIKLR